MFNVYWDLITEFWPGSTKWKTPFQVACKKGQFDNVEMMVNNQFKAFSINLNAQHVNGMTPFDLDVHFVSSKNT